MKLSNEQFILAELLYNQIRNKTKGGKIICPTANQHEEIWVCRKECLSVMHQLSLGIQIDSELNIQSKLFEIFAHGFLNHEENIHINYSVLFPEDPVEELRSILEQPFFVAINPPLIGGIKKTKEIKQMLLEGLNQIRETNVTDKVSFNDQKELEYMAEYNNIINSIKQSTEACISKHDNNNDMWNLLNCADILIDWKCAVLKNKNNTYSLLDFYKSNYYRQIPSKKISVNFFAKLMTDKQPIRSGDLKDIEHISLTFPFVDLFITDKQRKTQILRHGYDKEYNTKVCYAGDIDIIKSFFADC